MENTNQESNTHIDTTQPPVPVRGSPKKMLLVLCVAIGVVFLIGVGVYLIFSKKSSDSNQFPFSISTQKQIPIKGCGNNLCEEGETFESCPTDCTLPSSIEPYIVTTSLSVADFPPPPKDTQWATPKDTHWSKFLDNYTITAEGGYLPPALNNFKLLYGKQTAIRLAEYGDTPDVEIAMDDMARIDQYVLVYSSKDIEKVFAATTKSIYAPLSSEMISQDLPDPGIGDKSKAFKFYAPDDKDRYIVVFIKGVYFEMIMLSGTMYEYKVLEDIARKAVNKIQ